MFLQKNKTVAMQRLLEHFSHGYYYYQKGFVNPLKLKKLIIKFCDLYKIQSTRNQKYYRKTKNQANTFFTCYPVNQHGSVVFIWFLLATDGVGKIHDLEKLNDGRNPQNRINWDFDYEIVKISSKGKKTAFTWRMTKVNFDSWVSRIRQAVKEENNSSLLKQCIWSLKRTPGFRGNRENVKELFGILKGDLKRVKSKSFLLDGETFYHGYVRKLKNNFIDLGLALDNISKNRKFDYDS